MASRVRGLSDVEGRIGVDEAGKSVLKSNLDNQMVARSCMDSCIVANEVVNAIAGESVTASIVAAGILSPDSVNAIVVAAVAENADVVVCETEVTVPLDLGLDDTIYIAANNIKSQRFLFRVKEERMSIQLLQNFKSAE